MRMVTKEEIEAAAADRGHGVAEARVHLEKTAAFVAVRDAKTVEELRPVLVWILNNARFGG